MELEFLTNLARIRTPEWDSFMLFITSLGSDLTPVVIYCITVLVLIYKLKRYREVLLIGLSLTITQLISNIIKILVQRARPPETIAMFEEIGYSFPSNHAMLASAFYGMLFWQLSTLIKNKKYRYALRAVGLIFSLLLAFSRLYLGVHWPSDVLTGLLLGWLFNWLLLKNFTKRQF